MNSSTSSPYTLHTNYKFKNGGLWGQEPRVTLGTLKDGRKAYIAARPLFGLSWNEPSDLIVSCHHSDPKLRNRGLGEVQKFEEAFREIFDVRRIAEVARDAIEQHVKSNAWKHAQRLKKRSRKESTDFTVQKKIKTEDSVPPMTAPATNHTAPVEIAKSGDGDGHTGGIVSKDGSAAKKYFDNCNPISGNHKSSSESDTPSYIPSSSTAVSEAAGVEHVVYDSQSRPKQTTPPAESFPGTLYSTQAPRIEQETRPKSQSLQYEDFTGKMAATAIAEVYETSMARNRTPKRIQVQSPTRRATDNNTLSTKCENTPNVKSVQCTPPTKSPFGLLGFNRSRTAPNEELPKDLANQEIQAQLRGAERLSKATWRFQSLPEVMDKHIPRSDSSHGLKIVTGLNILSKDIETFKAWMQDQNGKLSPEKESLWSQKVQEKFDGFIKNAKEGFEAYESVQRFEDKNF